ncbi:hypothetical protein EV643_105146 [Kribbella sp. VKM Ac-2527]|uniref:DUF5597 domain-containing protein n=1 Tax=Kribbella caucasensis TaxID=2512215 RepID=A0A4R6KHF7_9ACTN|nr:DUF5597 domain-containing protein [Kribbella sp. VKM Ac-2527]TDO49917.1 hypothetical protein EV643_105146 [Kribbella sp. VKM Ac-2527]
MPTIDRSSGPARLIVDGSPYHVRGVELHNSSSSSSAAFRNGLATAAAVHANTVLASVTWEGLQPEANRFDFTSVERLILDARAAGTRLVLLWFGAWKNGTSSYAPAWVKRDWRRFARCVLEDGSISDTLTPFGDTDLDRDAFVALVRFVEEFDADDRTVLMIQIENEVGLLGSSRDHSTPASVAFEQPIPPSLRGPLGARAGFSTGIPHLRWTDVEDDPLGRDEAFMAWGYAAHVQKLAAAARAHSSLPLFVNAWLDSDIDLNIPGFTVAGGQLPGMYPSGGPLPRVADVWTTVATDVDLFAPDVYFGDTEAIYASFSAMSGGLFIPEQRSGEDGVGAAFLAFGEYQAIGVSPFGVDSRSETEVAALADAYRILEGVAEMMTAADGTRVPTRGFHLTDDRTAVTFDFGDVRIDVNRASGFGVDDAGSHGYGIILDLGDDTFAIAGRGFHAVIDGADPAVRVCIEQVVELEPGRATARVLNGDETGSGSRVIHPPRERVVSQFPIAAGHAHTGLSTVRVYRIPRTVTRAGWGLG